MPPPHWDPLSSRRQVRDLADFENAVVGEKSQQILEVS